MTCGYYDSVGRPYIDGVIFLPHNDRLGEKPLLPISFLVDTGADRTLIVPSGYESRGVEYSDFFNHVSHVLEVFIHDSAKLGLLFNRHPNLY